VAASAIGLGAIGLVELLLAVLTGSVGLLGDAIHNLSDVSTSVVVLLGFRLSRRPATERYPMAWRGPRTWPGSDHCGHLGQRGLRRV
jgi:divalent metal cation (Fe/Co/Zn/Cd) transporter